MKYKELHKVLRHAEESGQSEAIGLAEFVHDALDPEDLALVVASMDEFIWWARRIKSAAKEAAQGGRQVSINLRMQEKLDSGEALNVLDIGEEVGNGLYRLHSYEEGKDYCDPDRKVWIWEIGRLRSDPAILIASATPGALNRERYDILWLR